MTNPGKAVSRAVEIAGKLSKAQRECLLKICPGGKLGVRRGYGHVAAKVAISMPELVERYWRGDSFGYRLTPSASKSKPS